MPPPGPRRLRLLLVFSVLLVGSVLPMRPAAAQVEAAPVDAAPVGAAQAAQIDALFARWQQPDTPGAAVAVVRAGRVIYENGYGIANLEYGIPITPTTVFHVASVSKQFTAFAVNLLAAEGRLSLDDDIRTYIPEVPDFGTPITLRHLIHHTSGLRDQWSLLALAGWRLDDVITKEHVLKLVARQRDLNFTPGAEYVYCNTGYTLLAEVVERVAGQPFPAWTAERIFRPLGMEHTHFHDDHRMVVPNRAYSYAPDGSGYRKSVLSFANVGATSLFTTAHDLALWMAHFGTGTVGGADVLAQLHERGVLNDGETITYAHGIYYGTYRGLETIGHSGGDAGFRSETVRFPEHDLSVVVLSNLGSMAPWWLARSVAAVFLEDAMTLLETPGSPSREAEEPFALPTEALAAYAGTYYSEELDTSYHLSVEEGRLVAHHPRHGAIHLTPHAEDAFDTDAWFMGRLAFTRQGGRVTGFKASSGRVRNLRFVRR